MADGADRQGTAPFAGRSMRWSRRGPSGAPGVLLLGGVGIGSWAWDAVAETLPADVAVTRLDRPGLGTPWPGRLPTLTEEVDGLVAALSGGSPLWSEPTVVVAHSMAAFHAEALVRTRPELVAGLVLVDGSVEIDPSTIDERAEARWLRTARAVQRGLRLPGAGGVALAAMTVGTAALSSVRHLGDRLPPTAAADFAGRDGVPMVIAESAAYGRQAVDLAALRTGSTWPGVPTRVLTARGPFGERWVRQQQTLAALLAADHTVVAGSRHLMMYDRPTVISAAVRQVLGCC